jgi:hypothetical protein
MEYTGCGNTEHRGLKDRGGNTEHRGLKDRDCHLVQIILRKVAGEHVLHCYGSLKVLAIPRV